MQPLVSVIIPVYNRSHLIGETIDSVLAQSYRNLECIVVDDLSTDYIAELLEFYREKDTRVHFFHRPIDRPKGANACRNCGLEVSKGEYVQWLDSDDLISEDKIKAQVEIFLKNAELDICFCKCVFFKNDASQYSAFGDSKFFTKFETPKELFDHFGYTGTHLPPHAYLMKKDQIKRAGGWNEYLKINQDGEFFSRVLITAKKIAFSENGKAYYRRRSTDNTSLYNSVEKVEDSILSWKLIEQQHRIRYKNDSLPYIENAKETIFPVINKNFPEVIIRHRTFFKKQLRQKSYFYKFGKNYRFNIIKKIFFRIKKFL